MPKGQKKTKGIPELYNEVKKLVSLSLIPSAIMELDNLAKEYNLSRSELVEQIARGLIPLTQEDSLTEEFIIYPTQLVSIQECDRLPEKMGAFIVTDLENFAYVNSCSNLKKKFENRIFLNKLKQNFIDSWKLSQIKILWLECEEEKAIFKIQEELISQFRSSEYYKEIFANKIQPKTRSELIRTIPDFVLENGLTIQIKKHSNNS